MRIVLGILIAAFIAALAYLAKVAVEINSDVHHLSARLKSTAGQLTSDEQLSYSDLKEAALAKAALYEEMIQENHLFHGMVVNRHIGGQVSSECDSLLFSALRYVALVRLGWNELAAEAWQAILQANDDGLWHRHPKCRRRWTSRDMIVGVLAALSQQPPHFGKHVEELVQFVKKSGGYIGKGPFYVSKLSPGIAELIRLLAQRAGVPPKELPSDIRYAFSTIEFDAIAGKRGYTSHLNGLVIWIEMELLFGQKHKLRSVAELLDRIMGSMTDHSFEKQRLQWVSGKLVRLDGKNMFFRWLQLLSSDAVTPKARYQFLTELMAMEQFPPDRLPQNCDRKADYLWQRDSVEYKPIPSHVRCIETYSGVDFLWMLSLILEPN